MFIDETCYYEKGDYITVLSPDNVLNEQEGRVVENQRFTWSKVKVKLNSGEIIEVKPSDLIYDE